jgi:hypothetical protein
MTLIGEQICKQMELTAALMSDPTILRTEPSVVASSFAATLKKVDMLQVYLRPRDGYPTPRCDASIIVDGVKQLVYLTMDKQMHPLKNPMASIVQTDLRKAYDTAYDPDATDNKTENYAEREIKETNCMAGMVLLQYYIQWHLLLMNINQLEAPYRDDNMDKDMQALKSLPTVVDLLEFRPLKTYFSDMIRPTDDVKIVLAALEAGWKTLTDARATTTMMLNPGANNPIGTDATSVRKSSAVAMYQIALAHNPTFHTKLTETIATILNEIHQQTSRLTGGVLTTLQLQDETQIWKDMQTQTNVVSVDHNSNQTRYSYTLQNVVSNAPYFDSPEKFLKRGTALCVYNYNSTPLMADICVSMAKLTAFNRQLQTETAMSRHLSADLTKCISEACVQTKALNTDVIASIRKFKLSHPPDNDFQFFINETANHARARNGTLPFKSKFTVDDVAGYYISKGNLTSMERSNHVYLAHPIVTGVPVGQAGFVPRMQNIVSSSHSQNAADFTPVSYCTRNSMFTIYGMRSALSLLERVKSHPVFMASTGAYKVGTNPETTRADVLKQLNDEQKAFRETWDRLAKSGQGRYPKYAGVSWPVHFKASKVTGDGKPSYKLGNDIHSNADVFTVDGYIPRTTKGTNLELVQGVVDIADGFNMLKIMVGSAPEARQLASTYHVNGTPLPELAQSLGIGPGMGGMPAIPGLGATRQADSASV